jgi:integrase
MAKTINKLSQAFIAGCKTQGHYADGHDGLYLQVARKQNGKGVTKSWVMRYKIGGKKREMGQGSIRILSLAEAREKVRKLRQLILEGLDPIAERKARLDAIRADGAGRKSFKEAAERLIAAKRAGWRSGKHQEEWPASLERLVYPRLGAVSVAAVSTDLVLAVLEPIWTTTPETASRVRGRIEAVLDYAKARHWRSGENPARWRGHLDHLLVKPAKLKKPKAERHLKALAYAEVPALLGKLGAVEGIAARTLEFVTLTGVRVSEALKATWEEIDFAKKVWSIPGSRTKSGQLHRVPLTRQVIELLKLLPRGGSPFLFPSSRKSSKTLASVTVLAVLHELAGKGEATVHGLRSSFRQWAAERTSYPREICEAALGHMIAGDVEAAYQRGDFLEKRRRLMTAWSDYCTAPAASGKITHLRRGKAA